MFLTSLYINFKKIYEYITHSSKYYSKKYAKHYAKKYSMGLYFDKKIEDQSTSSSSSLGGDV